jgi:hypothetical protein
MELAEHKEFSEDRIKEIKDAIKEIPELIKNKILNKMYVILIVTRFHHHINACGAEKG